MNESYQVVHDLDNLIGVYYKSAKITCGIVI